MRCGCNPLWCANRVGGVAAQKHRLRHARQGESEWPLVAVEAAVDDRMQLGALLNHSGASEAAADCSHQGAEVDGERSFAEYTENAYISAQSEDVDELVAAYVESCGEDDLPDRIEADDIESNNSDDFHDDASATFLRNSLETRLGT